MHCRTLLLGNEVLPTQLYGEDHGKLVPRPSWTPSQVLFIFFDFNVFFFL